MMPLDAGYRIHQASASAKWLSPGVLSALPLPGTEDFARLMAALGPFGVAAQDIALNTPSNKLSDVALVIGVSGAEIRLMFTYTGLEIVVEQLLDRHLEIVPGLAMAVLQCCRKAERENPGRLEIRYLAHLILDLGAAKTVLTAYLSPPDGTVLISEGLEFRIPATPESDILEGKVILARSVRLTEGLFVDVTLAYSGAPDIAVQLKAAIRDVPAILNQFGLRNLDAQ